jgi:hypothetical protein
MLVKGTTAPIHIHIFILYSTVIVQLFK